MAGKPRNIADIRADYMLAELTEATVGNDPIAFFDQWFIEADTAGITEVNAMTLATVDAHHSPHARIVLLKGVDERGFSFFTNYASAKGVEIGGNEHVALLFFWKELERQVRIEGTIAKLPEAESDEYFASRPVGSRIGAWASPQSEEITDRSVLDEHYARYEKAFASGDVPRPPHWGGYVVTPQRMEFWQGRPSRMHDRIVFSLENGVWGRSRLAP